MIKGMAQDLQAPSKQSRNRTRCRQTLTLPDDDSVESLHIIAFDKYTTINIEMKYHFQSISI